MKEGEEIFCIDKKSEEYPENLREISDAPKKIYARGNYSILHTLCFAVVGSREISAYGKQVIKKIVPSLSKEFTIVSGMALGSDGAAHGATIEMSRPTVAVLGCGVDSASVYPTAHTHLQKTIIETGGCVVSEYPAGTRARPEFFPARNRIIAGLSSGILITEAAKDSGTMITARLALDYGRDVFVVPGSIFSPLSAGVHWLLKQGAAPVTEAQDIFDVYQISTESMDKNKKLCSLSEDEQKIMSFITNKEVCVEQICTSTKLSAQRTLSAITSLEINGYIKNLGGYITK